jgi:hypothetical protein
VRNRRNPDRGLYARATSAGRALPGFVWAKATRRPVDALAVLAAAAASIIIVINAVFLQSGSHPAPFVTNSKSTQIGGRDDLRHLQLAVPPRSAPAIVTPQPVAVRREDPIADLINPSPRVAAVQRVLSDYGYGQIKPSGILDDATTAAIEKFQRERKLQVTGTISDRLMGELAVMAGHPLE